jgi:probable phosphoglycerate mutase
VRRVVFLARHGETEWNREGRWQGHTDVELNATGHGQARALAETLRAHAVERIYTSDLLRARQTAEAVATALGVRHLVVDRALRERSFGIFEGLTRDECQRRHPDLWARYRANPRDVPPGAETHDILAARMHAAIQRALAPDPEPAPKGPVLIVSHGGSIRALLSHLTGTMPPPLENVAVFRAVATAAGLEEIALLPPAS